MLISRHSGMINVHTYLAHLIIKLDQHHLHPIGYISTLEQRWSQSGACDDGLWAG